jgi:hypothetical protein
MVNDFEHINQWVLRQNCNGLAHIKPIFINRPSQLEPDLCDLFIVLVADGDTIYDSRSVDRCA